MKRYVVTADITIRVSVEVDANSPIEALNSRELPNFYERMRLGHGEHRSTEFVSARPAEPAPDLVPSKGACHDSPLYCEHANEAPNVCPCPADCYCQPRTCKRLLRRDHSHSDYR